MAVFGAAEVRGLQQSGLPLAACLKHYVGDGATEYGTGTWMFVWTGAPPGGCEHGDVRYDERMMREACLAPYLPALAAGCMTVSTLRSCRPDPFLTFELSPPAPLACTSGHGKLLIVPGH